jgi:hypothetical protein
MAKWDKQTLKLAPDHAWEAKEGYQVVVLDRGAVRFDVPRGWVIGPGEGAIELRDRESPDDKCLLQVTILPLPAGADTSALPLVGLLAQATEGADEEVLDRGLVEHVERPGLELAWRETRYVDSEERREARSRTCLARGVGVHTVLTMSFWPEDAGRFEPVWDEVLGSLRLGEYVEATTGRPRRR